MHLQEQDFYQLLQKLEVLKTRDELEIPNIQLHFVPALIVDHGREVGVMALDVIVLIKTKITGTVTLKSSDPFADPIIDPRFLTHPDDMQDMIDGYKNDGNYAYRTNW